MGKPLKAKQLNLVKGQRDRVLKFQGVKISKRVRLGHTGHFGKVDVVPIEGKPSKHGHRRADEGKKDGSAETPDLQDDTFKKLPKLEGKLPGESYTKFMKRVQKETREALVQLSSKSHKVSSKRKAYLDGRKDMIAQKKTQAHKVQVLEQLRREVDSKGQTSSRSKHAEPISMDEAKASLIASTRADQVRFGEQAERPPQIKISKPLKGLRKPVPSHTAYVVGGVPAIPEVSGAEKSKREFEMLRQNAVKSYREMVRKKREGKGQMSLS